MNAERKSFEAEPTAATAAYVSGYGQSDTHAVEIDGKPKPHRSAGTPYNTITGREIGALVRQPQSVPKERARWFIPSIYHGHDARSHRVQEAQGLYWFLALDVDQNNPSLDDVRATLANVLGGTAALIYSSRSATADIRKWRALVPLAEPLPGSEFADTQNAFFDLLEEASAGVLIPDRALARTGQLVYLPNRGEFYEWHIETGERLALSRDHQIIIRREAIRAQWAEAEARARAERERRHRERAARGDDSVAERYNADHDLVSRLESYGYKRAGGSADWRSPMQASGSYATKCFGDYWVSLSASDMVAEIGRLSMNGASRFGDAFDLFVHFEHDGDFTAAVRAYAEESGMSYDGAQFAGGPEFAWQKGAEGKGESDKGEASAGVKSDWPDPLPIVSNLPPVEPFAPELLPDPLRDYVLDVADRQQAPADFAAVVALCGLGAILGNRVRVLPKRHDDWTITPNLWGAIIGRPSAMKTPGMRAALAPVYRLQDQMREEWLRKSEEAKVEIMLAGLDAKEAKKRAEKAMKAGDKDAAREIIEGMLKSADEEAASAPRLIVNDSSVEKLGELLNENPRGLLLERDELPGWLARMSREEFQGERAFYLEAFNGDGRFTYDRIGRGTVHIENCTLSVIGGAQPSRIAHLVRGAQTGEADDGLVQRLQLAVWPDDVHSWQWVDRAPNSVAREAYDGVFEMLNAVALARNEEPMVLRFSAEAQQHFKEWMTEIQSEARGGNIAPTLESHILKMPKTVASLALIFEMVDGGRFEIGETATLRALDWADYLRSHANRLYAAADSTFDDAARLILERRSQLPEKFTARDVHRRGWASLADRDTVSAALGILVSTHHCREARKTSGQGGGRPTSEFIWHPSLRR